eukprot:scaffold7.g3403.t1
MSRRNLLKYATAMVEAGVWEKPLWFDAVKRIGVPVHRPGHRPARIDFPEDKLLQVYYMKYPEAKLEPVDLTSYEPPTARRFVLRQAQLMAGGMPRKDAFAAVEAEFAARGENPGGAAFAALGASSSGGGGIVEAIQAEEEAELNAGLQTYVDRHGPIAAPRRPAPWRAGGARPDRGPPRNVQALWGALKQGQQQQQQQRQQPKQKAAPPPKGRAPQQ